MPGSADPRLSPLVLEGRIKVLEDRHDGHEEACDERHRVINDTLGSARTTFKVLAIVVPFAASIVAGLVIYIHNDDRADINTAVVNGQTALTEIYAIKGLLEGKSQQ